MTTHSRLLMVGAALSLAALAVGVHVLLDGTIGPLLIALRGH